MKLVEIKCPFCGGKVNQEKIKNWMVTCEYCGNVFYIDNEKQQYVTNHYQIYQNNGPEKNMTKTAVIIAAATTCMVLAFLGIFANMISRAHRSRPQPYAQNDALPKAEEQYKQEEDQLYQVITSAIFSRSYEEVTQEEIASVKYLNVHSGYDQTVVEYMLSDPYENEEVLTESVTVEGGTWNLAELNYFPGLVKVDVSLGMNNNIDLTELKQLKGIVCKEASAEQIREWIFDPAQLIELSVEGMESLEGIGVFENLEILSLTDAQGENLKELTALKKLRELTIEDGLDTEEEMGEEVSRISDYSALGMMTQLEKLSIESELLRDVGFLEQMEQLTSLLICESGAISLEAAGQLPNLKRLVVLDNSEVQNYDFIKNLSGLKELRISKSTGQSDPGFLGLLGLESLEIEGFLDISFLGELSGLKELSIHGCNMQGADALSRLSGLNRLTIYSVWQNEGNLRNLDFISEMTNLRSVDLCGQEGDFFGFSAPLTVYGDISAVFRLPNLEELYLSHDEFEIAFDKIGANETLKILDMTAMSLKENYEVQSDGFANNIWYDDVLLANHTDFFHNFPNLEELYLGSNQLADISFVSELKNLKKLDISDNYVTDLSPLDAAGRLIYLDVTDNPVTVSDSMKEKMTVVQ